MGGRGAAQRLHAIIVTGMYSDGNNTYVRIADPWDRAVGTPGTPGTMPPHTPPAAATSCATRIFTRNTRRRSTATRPIARSCIRATRTAWRRTPARPCRRPAMPRATRKQRPAAGARLLRRAELHHQLGRGAADRAADQRQLLGNGRVNGARLARPDEPHRSRHRRAGRIDHGDRSRPGTGRPIRGRHGNDRRIRRRAIVEAFHDLLANNGPLWVGAAVPGLHAIVVTGMYSDGTEHIVRVTDPWDRDAGTPGSPGPYAKTHATGSRYILRWADFVAEYERAATDYTRVNLQILHCGDTHGHTANTGRERRPAMRRAMRGARSEGAWPLRRTELHDQLGRSAADRTADRCELLGYGRLDGARLARPDEPHLEGIAERRTTTATGLDPAAVGHSQRLGMIAESPQCYTVEAFRDLLGANGPLWVGAASRACMSIVVTGLYTDGTDTFVRITDPWDRTSARRDPRAPTQRRMRPAAATSCAGWTSSPSMSARLPTTRRQSADSALRRHASPHCQYRPGHTAGLCDGHGPQRRHPAACPAGAARPRAELPDRVQRHGHRGRARFPGQRQLGARPAARRETPARHRPFARLADGRADHPARQLAGVRDDERGGQRLVLDRLAV